MTSSHIAATFGKAADLTEAEAQPYLRSIAKELWALLPAGGAVQKRDWLLDFVRQIAKGRKLSVRKIARKLPYERKLADRYVRLAAEALLDQARIDEERGLSAAGSVLTEVHKLTISIAIADIGGLVTIKSAGEDFGYNIGKSIPSPAPPIIWPNPDPTLDTKLVWYKRMLNPLSRSGRGLGRAFGPGLSGINSSILPDSSTASFGSSTFTSDSPLAFPTPTVSPRIMNDPEPLKALWKQQRLQQQQQQQQQQQRPVVPEPSANEYRVWFGTNRNYVDNRFTADRGSQVSYGFCDVYVPESHKLGSLGSSFLTRLVKMTDDRLKLRRVCPLPGDSFWQLIRTQLASVEEKGRHAVVFIHGYNVSFAEAALRAGQIGLDLGVEGAMAFFSWPSKGEVKHYVADGSAVEASEPDITDFLVNFAEESGATDVHVIAHSMGNRGVLRAVARIAQEAQERSGKRFANFILAAADVDAQIFRNFASAYVQIARRTTLYVSSEDKAVGLSAFISDFPRVGFTPPISIFEGIDTVSVSNIDLTGLGHGYIGEAREVLTDMYLAIFQNLSPAARYLERKTTDGGQCYWAVRG